MKHPPFIKIFCDKVTVNIYYSMHCVMVIRTAHHCVMGRARLHRCGSWPGTGQPKSRTKKCLFHEKKCVDHTNFAVRMTGQLYVTSVHILLENNF